MPEKSSRYQKIELQSHPTQDCTKACNESCEAQLTGLTSWTLTARNLVNKVVFLIIKGPDYALNLRSF